MFDNKPQSQPKKKMVESTGCPKKCSRHSVCSGVASSSGATTDKSSLLSRRRRHKTVHFGDNLLLQVCTNANISSQFNSSKMEPNVQQLFSFIETVLSAWVAEEGLTSQGEVSETDEKGLAKKRMKKQYAKVKRLDIRRLVNEVAKLNGTRLLGSLRYRHFHWKGTPEECNELFLRKVHVRFVPFVCKFLKIRSKRATHSVKTFLFGKGDLANETYLK